MDVRVLLRDLVLAGQNQGQETTVDGVNCHS
jgi:hypothetical protein